MVQYCDIDHAFTALSDPTRRAILERLGRGDASVSELAEPFGMTLTGMRKHLRVLEDAELVATRKVGRVRQCRLGPRTLEDAARWLADYRQMVMARMDRFADILDEHKEQSP